jgi:hypothetical protein
VGLSKIRSLLENSSCISTLALSWGEKWASIYSRRTSRIAADARRAVWRRRASPASLFLSASSAGLRRSFRARSSSRRRLSRSSQLSNPCVVGMSQPSCYISALIYVPVPLGTSSVTPIHERRGRRILRSSRSPRSYAEWLSYVQNGGLRLSYIGKR